MFRWLSMLTILLVWVFPDPALAAKGKKKKNKSKQEQVKPMFDKEALKGLEYRSIGPYRGGRSAAVTGVPGQPGTFYFGGTGGGVWRTEDGGSNWENVSDGFFGGSIGAVAVSEWDPNVIYVGGGEKTVRGNVSHGEGMWKTLDRGKTWKHIGLKDTRHIPRIRIHPKNPDLVYAAAMGHLFGPNDERGVFRSKDGGETWDKILFVNNEVGAVDLVLDPNNPRIMFASFWRVKRTPYSLESGGEGSSLWKSIDGGDNWKEITGNKGLPTGTMGIIGVTVSSVNSNRVWAIMENENGGVFRSDDGGETWSKINSERKLRQRAWYYSRIYADTQDENVVYVLNVRFWRSKDGGKTYESIRTPHGDHHDLWIDPQEPARMVIGDDGGAQVTFNTGKTWSTYHNQPTAQFYRVTTDNHFPYRIYAAQQDNSAIRILHRTGGGGITEDHWESTAGGESGHLAPHPENPEIVYGGSYGGFLNRINHETGEMRLVDVWPDNPMGHGAEDSKWRFQWNFPIFFSPHDPNVLYTAGNALFKSTNEGQSWEAISADMTRNDPNTMRSSGGPITKDNTGVEYYGTIFAAAESPYEKGVIWAGSDDGLVHVTKDGGANWQLVTPPGMPEWMQINSIDVDPFHKGGLYLAGTRYKSDDFQPYLYKTEDYGATWKKIVNGIPEHHFTRVIRADLKREGLLYAGTESGMYVSFDDGNLWQPFQMNLPIVPITDLALKDSDLIVATQGRSLWVLDDLTPIREMNVEKLKSSHLFQPRPSYRMAGGGGFGFGGGAGGENLRPGVLIQFYLNEVPEKKVPEKKDSEKKDSESADKHQAFEKKEAAPSNEKADGEPKKEEKADAIKLEILDASDEVIKTFSSTAKKRGEKLEVKKGFNRFTWNMRYPDAEDFEGMIVWSGGMQGPKAAPGQYKARLTAGGESQTVNFEIKPNPKSSSSAQDYQDQFNFLISVRDKLTETHKAIVKIRTVRGMMDKVTAPMKGKEDYKDVMDAAKALKEKLTSVEEALYQTKNRSNQDPLNFPIRLNDKLAGMNRAAGFGDFRPTDQTVKVRDLLVEAIDKELATLAVVLDKDVQAFNELVKSKDVPAIWLVDDEKTEE